MSSAAKEMKELVRAAARQGWRVVEGGKHLKLYSPDGRGIVTAAKTPSSRRTVHATVARMRKYGFRWKGR